MRSRPSIPSEPGRETLLELEALLNSGLVPPNDVNTLVDRLIEHPDFRWSEPVCSDEDVEADIAAYFAAIDLGEARKTGVSLDRAVGLPQKPAPRRRL